MTVLFPMLSKHISHLQKFPSHRGQEQGPHLAFLSAPTALDNPPQPPPSSSAWLSGDGWRLVGRPAQVALGPALSKPAGQKAQANDLWGGEQLVSLQRLHDPAIKPWPSARCLQPPPPASPPPPLFLLGSPTQIFLCSQTLLLPLLYLPLPLAVSHPWSLSVSVFISISISMSSIRSSRGVRARVFPTIVQSRSNH